MNVSASGATPEELAAIVAVLETFDDDAPPSAVPGRSRSRWREAARAFAETDRS